MVAESFKRNEVVFSTSQTDAEAMTDDEILFELIGNHTSNTQPTFPLPQIEKFVYTGQQDEFKCHSMVSKYQQLLQSLLLQTSLSNFNLIIQNIRSFYSDLSTLDSTLLQNDTQLIQYTCKLTVAYYDTCLIILTPNVQNIKVEISQYSIDLIRLYLELQSKFPKLMEKQIKLADIFIGILNR